MFLQRIRNHSLTSLCIISHHPFFSMFRECLFVLKKIIDACNESSSPQKVGASRQTNRYSRLIRKCANTKSTHLALINCLSEWIITKAHFFLLNLHRFFSCSSPRGKSLCTIFFHFAGTAKNISQWHWTLETFFESVKLKCSNTFGIVWA